MTPQEAVEILTRFNHEDRVWSVAASDRIHGCKRGSYYDKVRTDFEVIAIAEAYLKKETDGRLLVTESQFNTAVAGMVTREAWQRSVDNLYTLYNALEKRVMAVEKKPVTVVVEGYRRSD